MEAVAVLVTIVALVATPLLLLYALWNLVQALLARSRAGNGIARSVHLTLKPKSDNQR